MQTAERETVSSRKRTEVEKFKGRLIEQEADLKSANKLASGRLKDAVKLEAEKLRLNTQSTIRSETQDSKKKSQKEGKTK